MNTMPGYCNTEALSYIDDRLFKQTASFINPRGACCDISPKNAKMDFIKRYHGVDVEQIEISDLNTYPVVGRYDTVFCLEVIEHLQNPLFFMRNVQLILNKGGSIYLSCPGRPQFLWTEKHFIEYTPKHLKKWILDPLGLRIIRRKRIRINHPWWWYFRGIRPFFRIFLNYTNIYEIK